MNSIHIDLLGSRTNYYQGERFRTRVIEYGEGAPFILMHGGGGHAETYSRNLSRLGSGRRAMAPDFIWHGLSSTPAFPQGNWLQAFTSQMLELMDLIGAEKASFEGESLGAWIAMDMGINHPDRVEKIVLNTGWGQKMPAAASDPDWAALRETSLNALNNPTPELIRKRLDWLMPLGGVTDELVALRLALWSQPNIRAALAEYYDRLFSPECEAFLFDDADLARIQAPTLLFWSEKNPIAGPAEGERLRGIIPNAELYVMEGAAHWPQWERPEEHDRVVLEFLERPA